MDIKQKLLSYVGHVLHYILYDYGHIDIRDTLDQPSTAGVMIPDYNLRYELDMDLNQTKSKVNYFARAMLDGPYIENELNITVDKAKREIVSKLKERLRYHSLNDVLHIDIDQYIIHFNGVDSVIMSRDNMGEVIYNVDILITFYIELGNGFLEDSLDYDFNEGKFNYEKY